MVPHVAVAAHSSSSDRLSAARAALPPRETSRRLALARGSQDVGSPVLDQLLAVEVLDRIDEILPGRRTLLADRLDALLRALASVRPSWRAARPAGGMSIWAELPEPTRASALALRAVEHGVRVAPGPRFGANGGFEQRLRLPFTQPPDRLEQAIHRLAAAEDGLGRRPVPPAAPARWVA